jgi:hypothetical protein
MARPIRYQSRYPLSARALYAVLIDADYLRARLGRIGGTEAALLDHAADAEGAKYSVRQGVSRENLPGPVQRVMRGDLVIERTETWHRLAGGRYEGTVTARVKDAPGTITGALGLVDVAGDGAECVMSIDGSAKVDIPLVGGKIESAIAEQVVRLVDREARFTRDWLAR